MIEYGFKKSNIILTFLHKLEGRGSVYYFVITDDNYVEQHTNGNLDFRVKIDDFYIRERKLVYYKKQTYIELYNDYDCKLLKTSFLEKDEYYDFYEELCIRSLNKEARVKYSKKKFKSRNFENCVPLITRVKNQKTGENITFHIKTSNDEYFDNKLRVDSVCNSNITYEGKYVDASAEMYIISIEETLIINKSHFVEFKYGPILAKLDLEVGKNYALQFNPLNQELNVKEVI